MVFLVLISKSEEVSHIATNTAQDVQLLLESHSHINFKQICTVPVGITLITLLNMLVVSLVQWSFMVQEMHHMISILVQF